MSAQQQHSSKARANVRTLARSACDLFAAGKLVSHVLHVLAGELASAKLVCACLRASVSLRARFVFFKIKFDKCNFALCVLAPFCIVCSL